MFSPSGCVVMNDEMYSTYNQTDAGTGVPCCHNLLAVPKTARKKTLSKFVKQSKPSLCSDRQNDPALHRHAVTQLRNIQSNDRSSVVRVSGTL